MPTTKAQDLLHELNLEYEATRHCLGRIPEKLFDYKPHPTSMAMGYLTLLVAEIPLWIKHMIMDGEIDLATFKHPETKTTQAVVDYFEANMAAARKALGSMTEATLAEDFSLKSDGKTLYTTKKGVDLGVTINHWVHHRGQLTVYMRLSGIEVPSIYGPSADDKNFKAPE